MDIDEMADITKRIISDYIEQCGTSDKTYSVLDPIFSERLFNLTRYSLLNYYYQQEQEQQERKKTIPSSTTITGYLKPTDNCIFFSTTSRSQSINLRFSNPQVKKTEISSIRSTMMSELKSLRRDSTVIMPIKTTDNQCSKLMKKNYKTSTDSHAGMAHWIVAILHPPSGEVTILDSLNIDGVYKVWSKILTSFMDDKTFSTILKKDYSHHHSAVGVIGGGNAGGRCKTSISTGKTTTGTTRSRTSVLPVAIRGFGNSTVHQKCSVNCGYFCCLYILLIVKGKSIGKIENCKLCSDKYIEKKFKSHIKKYIFSNDDGRDGCNV